MFFFSCMFNVSKHSLFQMHLMNHSYFGHRRQKLNALNLCTMLERKGIGFHKFVSATKFIFNLISLFQELLSEEEDKNDEEREAIMAEYLEGIKTLTGKLDKEKANQKAHMLAKLAARKRLREEVTKEDAANKELDFISKKQVSSIRYPMHTTGISHAHHMGITCTSHGHHMHIM